MNGYKLLYPARGFLVPVLCKVLVLYTKLAKLLIPKTNQPQLRRKIMFIWFRKHAEGIDVMKIVIEKINDPGHESLFKIRKDNDRY